MTRILLLGLDPETVDFSDPALPPGMTVEKVRAGIAVAVKQFTDRGWESDVGFILPDETAGPAVERQLRSTNYDCVVIGGGVRLPLRHLALFEVVIDAIRKAAPGAAIAFNTWPDDSADAAARIRRSERRLQSPGVRAPSPSHTSRHSRATSHGVRSRRTLRRVVPAVSVGKLFADIFSTIARRRPRPPSASFLLVA